MKQSTRSTLMLSVVVLAAGIAGFLFLMRKGSPPDGVRRGAVPRTVDLMTARYARQSTTIRALGRVHSAGDFAMAAQVGGRVMATAHPLGLKPGLRVQAGTLLCLVDTTDHALEVRRLRSLLRQTEAQLELARAATTLARRDLDRQDALLKADNTSPVALEQARLTLLTRQEKEVGLAGQTGPEGSLALSLAKAELQLDRCRIIAPFDLEVSEGSVVAGALLAPGQTVARVQNLASLELRVSLGDEEADWVSMVAEDLPVTLRPTQGADTTLAWTGRLAQLSQTLDAGQQTREALVSVPGNQAGLRPGMLVEAMFTGLRLPSAVRIPRRALREQDRVLVWRRGLLEIAQVEVAWTDRHEALLTGGVAEGDTLVLTPIQDPVPGMPLRDRAAALPASAGGKRNGEAGAGQ